MQPIGLNPFSLDYNRKVDSSSTHEQDSMEDLLIEDSLCESFPEEPTRDSVYVIMKAVCYPPLEKEIQKNRTLLFKQGDFSSLAFSVPERADPETFFANSYERAGEEGNISTQIACLEKLAILKRKEKKLIQAADLLNCAIHLVENTETHPKQKLIDALEEIKEEYMNSTLQKPLLASYKNSVHQYRARLKEARNRIYQDLRNRKTAEEACSAFTHFMRRLLIDIIQQGIDTLGPPPTEYAIVGLRELATGEMLPYSDLAFAILILNGEHKEYFRLLALFVKFEIFILGESPTEDVPLIERNSVSINLPRVKGCRLNREGLWPGGKFELIGTPEELACFHSFEWQQSNSEDGTVSRALLLTVFLKGSTSLLKRFHQVGRPLLSERDPRFMGKVSPIGQAEAWLRNSLNQYFPHVFSKKEAREKIHVMQELYQPLRKLIQSLAFYEGLETLNALDTIKALSDKDQLSFKGERNLQLSVSLAFRLCCELQLFYGGNEDHILLRPKKGDYPTFPLHNSTTHWLQQIYGTLIALAEALKDFDKGPAQSLKRFSLCHLPENELFVASDQSIPGEVSTQADQEGYLYSLLLRAYLDNDRIQQRDLLEKLAHFFWRKKIILP